MWADWHVALKNKWFCVSLILSFLGLVAFGFSLPYFFSHVLLTKPGIQLNDFALNFFTPRDWSIEIFILLYSSTLLVLFSNILKPKIILIGFQVYVVVNFLRIVSLYLFTLEAPEGTVPLRDPILNAFVYGQSVFVKDLFFSGHVSSLFLLFLIEERWFLKRLLLLATGVVAVLLAWQRVHYTLDMIAAPVVTWMVWRAFKKINARIFNLSGQ